MKARKVAVEILNEIFENKAYNNIILKNKFSNSNLTRLDKAFITQIVNGTIMNVIYIDYIIAKFVKIKIKKMDMTVLNILRTAIYQLYFMDKVPDNAICNEAVNLTKSMKKIRLSGFVNGVIRNIMRNRDTIELPDKNKHFKDHVSIKYSYPKWIVELWLSEFDKETVEKICEESNKPPKVSVCVNTLKTNSEKLKISLEEKGVEVEKGGYLEDNLKLRKVSNISNLEEYVDGDFHVQDESSMLAVKALDPKENEIILDICAAPGGKSFYMAQKMNNKGGVIARDIFEHKIDLINDGKERLGTKIIRTEIFDASELDEDLIGECDRVLVDAPCSGLGIIRKKPDIKINRTKEDLDELVELQRKILDKAAKYVRKGGVLVYSTCTINKGENIENAKWFEQNYDFKLDDMTNLIPESLKSDTKKDGYIQILPSEHNMDGFFISRFIKD